MWGALEVAGKAGLLALPGWLGRGRTGLVVVTVDTTDVLENGQQNTTRQMNLLTPVTLNSVIRSIELLLYWFFISFVNIFCGLYVKGVISVFHYEYIKIPKKDTLPTKNFLKTFRFTIYFPFFLRFINFVIPTIQ